VLASAPLGRYKGVCFFDDSPGGQRTWVVADPLGRCLARGTASPVAERDCFTVYDDARCRGADLQLRRDAVGLLTLGQGITKDKVCVSVMIDTFMVLAAH
jgi:hypothetical protein